MSEPEVSNILTLMHIYFDRCGFQRSSYEDFMDEFVECLKACRGSKDLLCSIWQKNEYCSQATIMLLRLLTSAYLQIHSDEYLSFVVEEFDIPKSGSQDQMKLFCQRQVECMGVESDQIHVVALSNALRSIIKIGYVDGSGSEEFTQLEFGNAADTDKIASNIGSPLLSIDLLYRPGHYDLLYR